MNYPSPCEKCTKRSCPGCGVGCQTWRARYLYRQKQINAKAKQIYHPKPVPVDKLCYRHPDEARRYLSHSPCEECELNKNCDIPCSAYLRWYDTRMELVRRKLYAEG